MSHSGSAWIRVLSPSGVIQSSSTTMKRVLEEEPAEGVYSVGRTYQATRVMQWQQHMERLVQSAEDLGWSASPDCSSLRSHLYDMLRSTGWSDTRFRLFIAKREPSVVRISIEPFVPLVGDKEKQSGVKCVTLPGLFRQNPSSKHTHWAEKKKNAVNSLPPQIHTGLLLSQDGKFLEGLDSNFFSISDGQLFSAKEGVLVGLSMNIVWEVAPSILPLVMEPLSIQSLPMMDEAFLTSSSRGVVPVVGIDDFSVGNGEVGPYTQAIQRSYDAWILRHLDDLFID